MATYAELNDLAGADAGLRQRVRVACIVAAHAIAGEIDTTPNHANRLKWASSVMANPEAESVRMLWFALAANKAADVATIQAVTDAQIQTAVDGAVDLFAQGG
jgi:hypothetical protein